MFLTKIAKKLILTSIEFLEKVKSIYSEDP